MASEMWRMSFPILRPESIVRACCSWKGQFRAYTGILGLSLPSRLCAPLAGAASGRVLFSTSPAVLPPLAPSGIFSPPLPNEVLLHIFEYVLAQEAQPFTFGCPAATLCAAASVSRSWRAAALDPSLWRRLVLTSGFRPPENSWLISERLQTLVRRSRGTLHTLDITGCLWADISVAGVVDALSGLEGKMAFLGLDGVQEIEDFEVDEGELLRQFLAPVGVLDLTPPGGASDLKLLFCNRKGHPLSSSRSCNRVACTVICEQDGCLLGSCSSCAALLKQADGSFATQTAPCECCACEHCKDVLAVTMAAPGVAAPEAALLIASWAEGRKASPHLYEQLTNHEMRCAYQCGSRAACGLCLTLDTSRATKGCSVCGSLACGVCGELEACPGCGDRFCLDHRPGEEACFCTFCSTFKGCSVDCTVEIYNCEGCGDLICEDCIDDDEDFCKGNNKSCLVVFCGSTCFKNNGCGRQCIDCGGMVCAGCCDRRGAVACAGCANIICDECRTDASGSEALLPHLHCAECGAAACARWCAETLLKPCGGLADSCSERLCLQQSRPPGGGDAADPRPRFCGDACSQKWHNKRPTPRRLPGRRPAEPPQSAKRPPPPAARLGAGGAADTAAAPEQPQRSRKKKKRRRCLPPPPPPAASTITTTLVSSSSSRNAFAAAAAPAQADELEQGTAAPGDEGDAGCVKKMAVFPPAGRWPVPPVRERLTVGCIHLPE